MISLFYFDTKMLLARNRTGELQNWFFSSLVQPYERAKTADDDSAEICRKVLLTGHEAITESELPLAVLQPSPAD